MGCAVNTQLISAFIFPTQIVQFPYFLYSKFQVSSHLLWLYSPVCVGPGRKPRRPVFSQRGSSIVAEVLKPIGANSTVEVRHLHEDNTVEVRHLHEDIIVTVRHLLEDITFDLFNGKQDALNKGNCDGLKL